MFNPSASSTNVDASARKFRCARVVIEERNEPDEQDHDDPFNAGIERSPEVLHTLFGSDSPSNPDGRKINTRTSNEKTMTFVH